MHARLGAERSWGGSWSDDYYYIIVITTIIIIIITIIIITIIIVIPITIIRASARARVRPHVGG